MSQFSRLRLTTFIGALLLLVPLGASADPQGADATTAAEVARYTQRIKANPQDATNFMERGRLYYIGYGHSGFSRAVEDFTRAFNLDPKLCDAYYGRGFAYNDMGMHLKAIADCTEAISINDKEPNAYFGRGLAYRDLGQHGKAIDDFTKAIALDPDYFDYYACRAVSYERLGKKQLAATDRRKAKELGHINGK